MKKTLSIILAVLVLISAFPITAFAADSDLAATGAECKGNISALKTDALTDADITVPENGIFNDDRIYEADGTTIAKHAVLKDARTVIDSLAVTDVVAPVAGQNPSYTASVPADSGYRIVTENYYNGVNWYDDGLDMSADDVFVAGREYQIEVLLAPVSDEYRFADAPSGTVNGKAAQLDIADPGQLISVLYTFTCPSNKTVLYTADVTIAEPVAGQTPSMEGTAPEGAGYYLGAIVWSDEDGNIDFGTFVAGKEYSTMIVAYAKSGYVFDDTHLTMQGTVNGVEKTFLVSGDSAIYVFCTFTCEGEPEILGDIDGDGEVSVIDATIIQRYAAGFNVPYSEAELLRRGDVDDDGEAGVIDATMIQRYDAGFNVPYPIGEEIA